MKIYEAPAGVWPICPHCKKELREIVYIPHGAWMVHNVYFCPHCRMLLSIGMNIGN